MSDSPSKKFVIKKPLQLIIFVLGGFLLILISILGKHLFKWPYTVIELLNAVGQALIIGPALSWILDLRSMVDYFKKITIESLISKEYLDSLPRDQLLDLRKECTAKIHLRDAESIEKGLINLDESVCELLTQPYLERYRQNTTCFTRGAYFVKKHYMEEYVINPLDTKVKFKEFPKSFITIPDGENHEDFLKVERITIKIDDGEELDYFSKVKIKKSEAVNDHEFLYNTILAWVDAEGKDLEIEFSKTLLINRVYEIQTPINDITFIKRVTLPVKSLKIDYTYNGTDSLRLIGSCFGTMSYSNDSGMKVIQADNYISIESFSWLLPGNGIFIVKTKK